MKTSCLAIVFLTSTAAWAQTSSAGNQVNLPAPTPYSIIANDANSRVWERTVYERSPDGSIVARKHRYTELASGLNYWQNGQWVPSKEEISILSDGSAVATNGQHNAGFPSDIAEGMIGLLTPDGKLLESRPVSLFYEDDSNSAIIAILTNSVGELVAPNEVVYPDAFEGAAASLRYTYTKAGFEQDIIIQGQLPDPAAYGLNPARTRLGVLTTFFDTNNPVQTPVPADPQDGLTDTTLTFGKTTMVEGRAFIIGNNSSDVPDNGGARTYKKWFQINGRNFLMEEVPYPRVAPQLQQLPPMTGRLYVGATNLFAADSLLNHVPASLLAAPAHGVRANSPKIRLATADKNQMHGLVLDYVTLNSTFTDYVLQGDTTYYISGNVNLYGTTTIEGGTVVKYATSHPILYFRGPVDCLTGPYCQSVFTAMDDDTVGQTISGSTGSPAGYYGSVALEFLAPSSPVNLHDLRILYASVGITIIGGSGGHMIRDCQISQVNTAINGFSAGSGSLENVLISQTWQAALHSTSTTFGAAQLTIDQAYSIFLSSSGGSLYLTNSLLVSTTNAGSAYTSVNNVTNSSGDGIFQTVGGGHYYLADDSPYRNAGLSNIDPDLLADLATKTTYPPVAYAATNISTATSFSPQAQRDTNAAPDLGYHYDPLDYIFQNCRIGTNVTFAAGTAAGWQGQGLSFGGSHSVNFGGTVTSPCYFVRCSTVQESDGSGDSTGISASTNSGSVNIEFTRFSALGDIAAFVDGSALTVSATNSEFWSGLLGGSVTNALSLNFQNDLLDRSDVSLPSGTSSASLRMQNCTFHGGDLNMAYVAGWSISVHDCAFDDTAISVSSSYSPGSYNAYLSTTNALPGADATTNHDVFLASGFNWQTSWFGDYYQATNSTLIDKGNQTADQVGLYHFTTQTNQVVEGGSTVDIGYHYVATDAYGNPLDTDGDGIADYLEDANGNGLYDAGDLGDWLISPYNGLSRTNGLLVFTPLK